MFIEKIKEACDYFWRNLKIFVLFESRWIFEKSFKGCKKLFVYILG
jgi:hypothetical protein